jgi:hypothetical protein
VEHFTEIPKLCNVASRWLYLTILLETVGPRVINRNFRDISLFTFDFKRRNFPSAGCATAANDNGSDADIFNGRSALVNEWLVSGTFATQFRYLT